MFTVKTVLDAGWHERSVGVADGLSREYVWGRDNKHTVEMTNADAARLQASVDAAEFTFAPVDADGDGAADADEEAS